MKVYNIKDDNFSKYGNVLEGYDYGELFTQLEKKYIPDNTIIYCASVKEFEDCKIKNEFKDRGFGGMPIQIGYVGGVNETLNCLEYHKSSEFNIAMDDIILVLGCVSDIKEGKYDLSKCEAFHVPAGVGVELFATTLHYAPFGYENAEYRVICVLPYGTNGEKPEIQIKNTEDKMCFGSNKWLMVHKDAINDNQGGYIGLEGTNISMKGLEKTNE